MIIQRLFTYSAANNLSGAEEEGNCDAAVLTFIITCVSWWILVFDLFASLNFVLDLQRVLSYDESGFNYFPCKLYYLLDFHFVLFSFEFWWAPADDEEPTDYGTRPFGQPLRLRAAPLVDGGGGIVDSKPPTMKRGAATSREPAPSGGGGSAGSGGARRKK